MRLTWARVLKWSWKPTTAAEVSAVTWELIDANGKQGEEVAVRVIPLGWARAAVPRRAVVGADLQRPRGQFSRFRIRGIERQFGKPLPGY